MAGVALGAAIPTIIGVIGGGTRWWLALLFVVPAAIVFVGAIVFGDYLRWRGTRYRCTPERLEVVFSLVIHSRKSLPRERIRSVDLTANPLHRLLGVAVLTIGTGQHEKSGHGRIKLDPLARADAESLRTELLHRTESKPAAVADDNVLAQLDWQWLRYAPMSFLAPTLGLAAFGALFKVADWFGAQKGFIAWVFERFREFPLVVTILVLLAAALVVGVVGALALFVEMWWNYRLEREPGGTLRVRRGLLTTRSITVEERRLRGIDLVEPLGNRLVGAARVDAVATGMRQKNDDDKTDYHTLLPAAPRAEAHRVAALVLREPVSPTETVRLRSHPVAARGRRLRWALIGAALPVLVLVVLGLLLTDVLLIIGVALAVVAFPVAVLLAFEAYRNLGHGITGRYLVARSGAVRRSTVALERDGVIGLVVKQSVFQRRKGLVTLTATTAAGSGAYSVFDAATDEALEFADTATPGILTPFLELPGKTPEGSAAAERSRF
ncbi:PH domain-containing protein [Amycolatopsis sp. NPDC059027]|uniref:PH domain-containing protein n=1 Tax=Amycolatopsis sp. NPDC059027 TaxID=3346709 RepID=UPI00367319F0